jgi:hypothetical protein
VVKQCQCAAASPVHDHWWQQPSCLTAALPCSVLMYEHAIFVAQQLVLPSILRGTSALIKHNR